MNILSNVQKQIFLIADVLTAFFTYKLLCATVRQRYFCICDMKDVSNYRVSILRPINYGFYFERFTLGFTARFPEINQESFDYIMNVN